MLKEIIGVELGEDERQALTKRQTASNGTQFRAAAISRRNLKIDLYEPTPVRTFGCGIVKSDVQKAEVKPCYGSETFGLELMCPVERVPAIRCFCAEIR